MLTGLLPHHAGPADGLIADNGIAYSTRSSNEGDGG